MKIMKKVFLLLVILFSVNLFCLIPVFAQVTATPIPTVNVPVPTSGVNLVPTCGDMNAQSPANRCCSSQIIKGGNAIPKTGNTLVDNYIVDPLNTFVEVIMSTVFIQPLQETVWKYVQPCISGSPSTPGDLNNSSCICVSPTPGPLTALTKFCQALSSQEQETCNSCATSGGIWTAVGCVYPNVKDFIEKTVLGFGIGLAGFVALLCIIYAAFRLQTSQGNPENIKKAQELLTSCIMGLMLIIFAVFILRLIGVDILKIPFFTK